MKEFYFISGLPRSGSTLLSAIKLFVAPERYDYRVTKHFDFVAWHAEKIAEIVTKCFLGGKNGN